MKFIKFIFIILFSSLKINSAEVDSANDFLGWQNLLRNGLEPSAAVSENYFLQIYTPEFMLSLNEERFEKIVEFFKDNCSIEAYNLHFLKIKLLKIRIILLKNLKKTVAASKENQEACRKRKDAEKI